MCKRQSAAINSNESGVQVAESSFTATIRKRIMQDLEKAKLELRPRAGLVKDGLIPSRISISATGMSGGGGGDAFPGPNQMQKAQLEQVRSTLDQSKAVLVADERRAAEDDLFFADQRDRELFCRAAG